RHRSSFQEIWRPGLAEGKRGGRDQAPAGNIKRDRNRIHCGESIECGAMSNDFLPDLRDAVWRRVGPGLGRALRVDCVTALRAELHRSTYGRFVANVLSYAFYVLAAVTFSASSSAQTNSPLVSFLAASPEEIVHRWSNDSCKDKDT